MTQMIQTERRWLRSVIAASAEPLPNFPWMRGTARRPAALRDEDQLLLDLALPPLPALAPRPRIAAIAAR
ncbi:hypothetical protein [Xinfangfangia pollutisoli]|uniref:hypothetical protein n=1 Tax=Xinfangfangia pollutisoli TaxID=2865960 RepID=UPI001CD7709B|nr:hypothetical protein [Xinfangfangia pollutisoli]